MNLQLSLIAEWWNMTNSLIKTEDYRLITPYWCNRFLLYKGQTRSKAEWYEGMFNGYISPISEIQLYIGAGLIEFKKFDCNVMTLGYPKSTDTERILKLEHKGIELRVGNPKWGADSDKLYFVIKHGAVLD